MAAALAAALVSVSPCFAQLAPKGSPWKALAEMPPEAEAAPRGMRPQQFAPFQLDRAAIAALLAAAPIEDTPAAAQPLALPVPMPDGTLATFEVVESSVMAPELQARYPMIRTYVGAMRGDQRTVGRFDLTPLGFHAQILGPGGTIYVDPYTKNDQTGHYASFYLKDFGPMHWSCQLPDGALPQPDPEPVPTEATGPTRKVYRAAVATTGEFTAAYGGTVVSGLSAVTTAINRTTGIYELECAIRFQLVANNDLLIWVDAAADPYTNSSPSAMLTENQNSINTIIGFSNYDIGHAFGTGGGGIAQLGVVGGTNKARGVSANFPPFGETPSTTLTVAHEMGHQFNAAHSWNGTNGGCTSDQWGGSQQSFEPGSGSTIMSYSGACGADDLAGSRDAYFSSGSYDRITAWSSGATGAPWQSEPTGNNAPTVNAGANFTIPARTPFVLTATGSDPDGDPLTYCWEQRNAGSSRFALAAGDPGTGPIIRSWLASSSPVRTIPRLSNLLANTTTPGEILPTTNRSLIFRCTTRDNKPGAGGTNTDEMNISVINTGTPFKVTFPDVSAGTLSGLQTVTWNVAGTTAAPISTANVKISLSTDGGNTFPTVLIASTPNDGSQAVQLPQVSSGQARIKVEAVGNIYFDVSDQNFTLTPAPAGVLFASGGTTTFVDTAANGNNNGGLDPGENSVQLTIPVKNSGLTLATGVTATLTSLTATATVNSGSSTYPDMTNNVPVTNASPFVVSLSSSHVCGNPVNLRMTVTSAQGTNFFDFAIASGVASPPVGPVAYSWTGATAIPDGVAAGVIIPVVVSGATGKIIDVNFRLDGSACSTTSTSTTVALNTTFVGDFQAALISPIGTTCTLFSRLTNGAGNNNGNNFCQTLFDSQGGFPSIQSQTASAAPFTGTFTPLNSLNIFNGQNPNGTWNVRFQDLAADDPGTIRAFSILLTTQLVSCQPPNTVPACSPADIATEGSSDVNAGPDGFLTGADFDLFLNAFFNDLRRASDNTLIADLTDGDGTGGPDEFLTGSDFDKFIDLFFAGC